MSTPTQSLDAKTLDDQLNKQILSGDAMGAFEKFYADEVVMQENAEAPRAGKDINRKFELEFFSAVETFHGARLLASAVSGDTAFGEWEYEITFKGGKHVKMTQVSVRRWKTENSPASVSTTTNPAPPEPVPRPLRPETPEQIPRLWNGAVQLPSSYLDN